MVLIIRWVLRQISKEKRQTQYIKNLYLNIYRLFLNLSNTLFAKSFYTICFNLWKILNWAIFFHMVMNRFMLSLPTLFGMTLRFIKMPLFLWVVFISFVFDKIPFTKDMLSKGTKHGAPNIIATGSSDSAIEAILKKKEFNDLYDNIMLEQNGTESKMTIAYLKDVSSLLALVAAVRDCNFELHLKLKEKWLNIALHLIMLIMQGTWHINRYT